MVAIFDLSCRTAPSQQYNKAHSGSCLPHLLVSNTTPPFHKTQTQPLLQTLLSYRLPKPVLVLQVAKHMIKNEIRLIYVFRSTLRPLFLPIISKLLIISTFCSYQKINYSSTDKHQTVQTIL